MIQPKQTLVLFSFFIYCFTAQSQIQASFTMNVHKGCPPLTVQFTNTTPGGTANSYQWDFGDGGTSTAFSPTYTYQIAGDYIVNLNGFDPSFFPLITALDSVSATSVSFSVLPEICLVTVDSTSTKNIIVWQKPTDPAVEAVNIYRESDTSWVLAGSVPQTDLSKLVDTNVVPNDSAYTYRIAYADSCGNESPISGTHTTMHLIAYYVSADVHLTWISYAGFGFTSSRVMRDTTGTGNFILLDSLPLGVSNYIDSNPPLNSEYLIEIIHPSGCIATKSSENHNSSRSNKTSAAPPANIIAENSLEDILKILPNPNDGKFNVIISQFVPNDFGMKMKIYDVLGEVVYQSSVISHQSSVNVDISKHGSGIYFLQISNENRTLNKKIIIQ